MKVQEAENLFVINAWTRGRDSFKGLAHLLRFPSTPRTHDFMVLFLAVSPWSAQCLRSLGARELIRTVIQSFGFILQGDQMNTNNCCFLTLIFLGQNSEPLIRFV